MDKFSEYAVLLFVIVIAPVIFLKIVGESKSVAKKILAIVLIVTFMFVLQFIRVFIENYESFSSAFTAEYKESKLVKIVDNPSRREFGCIEKEQWERLIDLAVKEEVALFKTKFMEEATLGHCVVFERNEPVIIVETKILTGYILVKREGLESMYWTGIDSIQISK
jgi:hypothetical protein